MLYPNSLFKEFCNGFSLKKIIFQGSVWLILRVISVQRFKMSCLTLVKKYFLMFLQSGGRDWVASLRSQKKNGKVLWKTSLSSRWSWGPLALTLPSLERSLIRCDNFVIKLRNVKKCFRFNYRPRLLFCLFFVQLGTLFRHQIILSKGYCFTLAYWGR